MSIQKPSRELSIEEILTCTFELYSKNFVMFLIPILIMALISGSFSVIIASYITEMPKIDPALPPEVMWCQLWSHILTLLAVVFIGSIISWIVGTITHRVCIKYVQTL